MDIQNNALLSDDARIQIRIEDGAFLYLDSGTTFNNGVAGLHRAFILTGKGVLEEYIIAVIQYSICFRIFHDENLLL